MTKHHGRLLAAPLVLGALLAPATADAARVSFRAEGASRTVVRQIAVDTRKRPVSRGGLTACSGASALGVLDVATGGAWDGTYFSSFNDYQITEIARERHPGTPSYWSFWVNEKLAPTGLCSYTPKTGDRILLLVDQGAGSHFPLELKSPRRAQTGRSFRVRVVQHGSDPAGKATPVRNAVVRGSGLGARTDAQGYARLHRTRPGRVVLRATKAGLTRSEYDTIRVSR